MYYESVPAFSKAVCNPCIGFESHPRKAKVIRRPAHSNPMQTSQIANFTADGRKRDINQPPDSSPVHINIIEMPPKLVGNKLFMIRNVVELIANINKIQYNLRDQNVLLTVETEFRYILVRK